MKVYRVLSAFAEASDEEKTSSENAAEKASRSYIHINGEIAAFVEKDNANKEKIYYTVTDIQGSVTEVLDSRQNTVWKSGYSAFGQVAGVEKETFELSFNGIYTGKDIDAETGLTYHWNRWRSEDESVWLSEDPARDGTNWYGYCGNNPLKYTDPNGLFYYDGSGQQKSSNGNSLNKNNSSANSSAMPRDIGQTNNNLSDLANLGNDITKIPILKVPTIIGHLLRHPDSYKIINGENKNLRGKDLLIVENKTKGESVKIPVSSIANMEGYGIKDSLSEGEFTFTYDPKSGSKYAPTVFTITSGTLFSEFFVEVSGETLQSDGTTETNSVPWRGHNTINWGSQGCITAQKNNPDGDFSDVIIQLNQWGISQKFDIPFSFGLGVF